MSTVALLARLLEDGALCGERGDVEAILLAQLGQVDERERRDRVDHLWPKE